jgi:hypothetical protein
MKRIVAKEFLLLVGCMVILLVVAVFGWTRNSWFEHRSISIEVELKEEAMLLDSLRQRAVPRHLDFLDLFEPTFVRKNYEVFLVSPFWTTDPFLTGVPGGPIMRKVEGDPFASSGTKPPFDPNKPYTVVADDPFAEFGGEQVLPPPPPKKINRRYLMCFVKALDAQGYLTPTRTKQLASICGFSSDDFIVIESELRTATSRYGTSWKPPLNAEEVYTSSIPDQSSVSWNEALHKRGVPREEMANRLAIARSDTSISPHLLIATRGLLCDTLPYTELRTAFDFLKERQVLRCDLDDLLYTLQNKTVPPSQEALDAFAEQKEVVNGLRKKQSRVHSSLWSEARQWVAVKWAAIVLLMLVYPIRLFLLGTRWAIRTYATDMKRAEVPRIQGVKKLRSADIFYLNKIETRLWLILGLAFIVYVLLNTSITSGEVRIGGWWFLLRAMCVAVITSFIFYVIVAHYDSHKRRDREAEEISIAYYHILVDSNYFLKSFNANFWELDFNDLNKSIDEAMKSSIGVNKQVTDPIRWRAQDELTQSMVKLIHVSKYQYDIEFDKAIEQLIFHLEKVLDISVDYDTLVFRTELRAYFNELAALARKYQFDFSDVQNPILVKKR